MFNNKKYLATLSEFSEEHNKLRNNPKSFIPALQDRLYRLDKHNRLVVRPGVVIKTIEGKAAIQEAIEFLESTNPIPDNLKISKALCKIAQSHADDLGKYSMVGHKSSEGFTLEERFSEYVYTIDSKGENITFALEKTAREHIIDLLIDDGVADRVHRLNLFNPDYSLIGVGIADHMIYGKCVVINYGQNLLPVDAEDGIMEIEDNCHLQVPEFHEGFLEKYFKKRFKRAYTMEEKYSKSPRPSSPSSPSHMETKKTERRNSHYVPPTSKIPKDSEIKESNKSIN